MTEMVDQQAVTSIAEKVDARLKQRYAAERRFKTYGMISIGIALAFLATLFVTIFAQGFTAFVQTEYQLEVYFDPEVLDPQGTRDPQALATADYSALIKASLSAQFPEVQSRGERRQLFDLVSSGADFALRQKVLEDPAVIGTRQMLPILASDDVDMTIKGHTSRAVAEEERRLSDKQLTWLAKLEAQDMVALTFNWRFFANGDSREPELAGVWGAIVGSVFSLVVTMIVSVPLGIATAVYLEEFAPKNKWTDLIEVNINNLAAVPSIVFGLLGLAVFLNVFGMPRSAPLVGGLVLSLITLPTIIIAARAALKAVPPSIREAALGLGASKLQMVTHHVLPLAMPGIMTGTIIGMAHALGETAPLLMIGMVAFIVDVPGSPVDPSTVLPVQVYLWADSPERAFVERTSAAIMVLLFFLACMNAAAIYLRKKFERRW